MSPFDKQVHADELKLRILLTDGCNKNCSFCLNDFQPKPEHQPHFAGTDFVIGAITSYVDHIRGKYPLQVYFSGGEPTLHVDLPYFIRYATELGCRITLNTNGKFTQPYEENLEHVDCIHYGTYTKSKRHAERVQRTNGSVQCVYSKRNRYVDFDFLEFYLKYDLPIKIFGDMMEDPAEYEKFAEAAVKRFPEADLSFRFIGVQENRGIGCKGCTKHCVTLKAGWVLPYNVITPCPQLAQGSQFSPSSVEDWTAAWEYIKSFHQR